MLTIAATTTQIANGLRNKGLSIFRPVATRSPAAAALNLQKVFNH